MTRMFWDASAFDQALNDWDVSSVVNMKGMFYSSQFNQPLNAWNVSSVTNMSEMFSFSSQFDQDISQWNVGNVTTCDDFALNASALQTGNKPTFTVSSCN
jgi:surface protein